MHLHCYGFHVTDSRTKQLKAFDTRSLKPQHVQLENFHHSMEILAEKSLVYSAVTDSDLLCWINLRRAQLKE